MDFEDGGDLDAHPQGNVFIALITICAGLQLSRSKFCSAKDPSLGENENGIAICNSQDTSLGSLFAPLAHYHWPDRRPNLTMASPDESTVHLVQMPLSNFELSQECSVSH